MALVAVGDGKKLHRVAHRGELGGRSAELNLAIVRMSADGENAKRLKGVRHEAMLGGGRECVQFRTVAGAFSTGSNAFILNLLLNMFQTIAKSGGDRIEAALQG